MIHRAVSLSKSGSRLDGLRDEPDGAVHRHGKVQTLCETGRDRGRERASRTMGMARRDAPTTPDTLLSTIPENIYRISIEVPALDQRGTGSQFDEVPAGLCHFGQVGNGLARQDLGFREVGRSERGERQKQAGQRRHCIRVKQTVTAGRCHDRVKYVPIQGVGPDGYRDGLDECRGGEHSGLERVWPEVFHDRVDLGTNIVHWYGMDVSYPEGVLCGNGSHHGGTEDTERVKRFEVGLDPCTASGVTPCHAERDRSSCCVHSAFAVVGWVREERWLGLWS